MEAVFHNVEFSNSSHGVTVRHAQMRHRVQCRTPDQHLRRLPGKLPRTHSLSEDRFHPIHLRLGQAAPMIADFLLPLFPSYLADSAQILIPNQAFRFAVAMLPDLRIPLRRYRRLGFSFPDRFITTAFVIRAIAADLSHLFSDLLKQVFEHLRVGDVVGRHHRRDDLTRAFIRAEMQFPPSPPFAVTMLANFPFTFTKDFHPRRIDDHMQRFVLCAARQGDFQHRTAAAQLAVMHHRQVQAEQPHQGTHQALGGAQGQMVNLFERRHRQDRRVGVGARSTALAGFFGVAPSRNHVITDPEGQASALDKRGVIVFPVAETVAAFGFLGLHTSRLPALSSPCFMQQSHFDILKKQLEELDERFQQWIEPIERVHMISMYKVNKDEYTLADHEREVKEIAQTQMAQYDPYQHMYALLDQLCPIYLGADPQQRAEIRLAVIDKEGIWSGLINYMYRAAER